MTNWIKPGSTIGIIGGGSTGRLLALSAKKLGYSVGLLDPNESCSAVDVVDWFIQAELSDESASLDLALKSDVIVYESDLFPSSLVERIQKTVPVPQGDELLSISQDRMLQKAFLESARVNIAPFATIVSLDDIKEAVTSIGFPCVLKSNSRDGRFKEHYILFSEEDIDASKEFLTSGTCVLEAWIPSDKEMCLALVKNSKGDISTFPITEMTYKDDTFYQAIAPAELDGETEKEIKRIGQAIAENLDFVGVMAIEIFSTGSGALYVNEIVAHPHRALQYTFNYPEVSQYDALIKAITGWPVQVMDRLPDTLVMKLIKKDEIDLAFTQAQIKSDWLFTFYNNISDKESGEFGHLVVTAKQLKRTLEQLSDVFD
ncbi:MAG: ATP-grasp domain-containing protein [Alkalibacterium gilvum]|uniref:5-(Carboxyamino)imidazole ribonucleotide synthase n=1 Tax=Alkalibacterium gilvum TaxID=1130080 RepID=A0A1H6THX7_9LACT|nr:ATP-grasp domain-containing protein [Alkalibacterium gilvum]SEI75870.1 5-(carboxyamino)imidazole ribonucleotide synthase [Alkalibacterium gilvum]